MVEDVSSKFMETLGQGGGGTPPVLNSTHVFACLTMLLLPFLYLLKVPDPAMYLHYTPGSRELYGRELEAFYHVVMAHLTLGSILGGIFLLMHARRFFYSLLFIAPFLLGACWLNGKRHVVALLVGMIVFLAVDRGYWRGHRFIQRAILSAFALLCFLAVYQYKLRLGDQSVAQRTVQEWYENLRLDLGRDHTIKFSLFCELYSQPGRILDYRGQSLMIYLTAPIPRYFWPEKPASYPYRLTSLAMQMPLQATGGALTTSILDEAISNFWLLGLFIGPWMISWVCQVAEKSHNKYMQAFSVFIVFFMQSTHLLAIYPFAVAWIVLGIRFHVFPSYEFSAGMRPSRSRCRSPVQNRRTL